jgi:hypothetical protein
MKYSHVESGEDQAKRPDDGGASVASSKRRFGRKRINSELSEPLTANRSSIVDEELGDPGDPYFVFRSDLQQKLEMVDESLAEYLRIVHETVGYTICVISRYFCVTDSNNLMLVKMNCSPGHRSERI